MIKKRRNSLTQTPRPEYKAAGPSFCLKTKTTVYIKNKSNISEIGWKFKWLQYVFFIILNSMQTQNDIHLLFSYKICGIQYEKSRKLSLCSAFRNINIRHKCYRTVEQPLQFKLNLKIIRQAS